MAEKVTLGSTVALRAASGAIAALLDVADVWRPDQDLEAREVHGVARLKRTGPVYVGGEIKALSRPRAPLSPYHDPRETRALFAERGFSRVIGYAAPALPLRAHEYVAQAALEIGDGLLLYPNVGDDPALARAHQAAVDASYVKDRALLSIDPAPPRHAGAREALLHALVLKNHGSSHVVLRGGDAAGVEGLFDAFSPGEIGVTPLFFAEAFWSVSRGGMATEKTAAEDAAARIAMTDAEVLDVLARGEVPRAEIMRPEVARALIEAARKA